MGVIFRFITRNRREKIYETEVKEVPNWLKELQDNSWEAELLVSGGAVFSLFQLTDVFM